MGRTLTFYDKFWSPSFWLPEGLSWTDVKSTPEISMPNSDDLWTYPLVMALLLLIFRLLVFNRLFRRLGKHLGLDDKRSFTKPTHIKIHESNGEIKKNGEVLTGSSRIENISEKFGQRIPSACDKFCNASFSLIYRSFFSLIAIALLYKEPWFTNISECWRGYPYHSVSLGLWWVYMSGLSFYWSLVMFHIIHPPLKGKRAFQLHHTFTITTITLSWVCNITRAGVLIFIIHDGTDVLLEAAKLCKYFNKKTLLDILFIITTVSWFVCRICLFGGVIIWNGMFDAHNYNWMPAVYLFLFLLIALFILNCLWMTMFFMTAFDRIRTGDYQDRSTKTTSKDIQQKKHQ